MIFLHIPSIILYNKLVRMGTECEAVRLQVLTLTYNNRYVLGAQVSNMCHNSKKGVIMVKHVILWTLKDELSNEEKVKIKQEIKDGLEGLKGKVPGLVDIKVYIDGLASSNADVLLDSTLENEESLKNYAVHPEHVAVADAKVRPYTKIRSCLDFEI